MNMRKWIYAAALVAAPLVAHADRPGAEARLEGGLLSFPGAAHDFLTPGATYGAGLSAEAGQLAGVEVSYQGATYNTKSYLPGPRENIAENGGQALLKLGPKTHWFDPYAMGGYGLSFINVAEKAGSAGLVQDDMVSKVPVGLGFDIKVPTANKSSSLLIGARSQYDFVFNDKAYQFIPGASDSGNNGSRSGDQINTQLTIGGKF